mmetsp:Transcript_59061/g.137508  ORF Transcript_59061/g.137508 Transcript_59061/m.137508 type:complete len:202 (-) Transcript_59061:105-710(-)
MCTMCSLELEARELNRQVATPSEEDERRDRQRERHEQLQRPSEQHKCREDGCHQQIVGIEVTEVPPDALLPPVVELHRFDGEEALPALKALQDETPLNRLQHEASLLANKREARHPCRKRPYTQLVTQGRAEVRAVAPDQVVVQAQPLRFEALEQRANLLRAQWGCAQVDGLPVHVLWVGGRLAAVDSCRTLGEVRAEAPL